MLSGASLLILCSNGRWHSNTFDKFFQSLGIQPKLRAIWATMGGRQPKSLPMAVVPGPFVVLFVLRCVRL